MDQKNHLRSSILDIYNRAVGTNVDAKTLTYLMNSIAKGENSLENITATLTKTSEYKEKIKSIFGILYFDTLGCTNTDATFESFWDIKCRGTNTIIENSTIERYLRGLPETKTRIAELIRAEFGDNNGTLSEQAFNSILEKYTNDVSYDYSAMLLDVRKIIVNSIQKEEEDKLTNTDNDATEKTYMNNECIIVHSKPLLHTDKLAAFESTFCRHMYVKEYFKYFVDNDVEVNDLPSIKKTYETNFNKTAQIYSNFCDVTLTDHVFVDKHLMRIDEPNYIDIIVDDIVKTKEYEDCMKGMLQKYYNSYYDMHMDNSDLEFLFNKVRSRKLHPHNNELVDILRAFKAETDNYIENIFEVFMRVLDRQPDSHELEEYLEHYRTNVNVRGSTLDKVNEHIACHLAQTLEFHDVIKKHIRKIHSDVKGKDITPSRLYNVLQAILKQVDVNIDNLDDRIRQVL